LPAGGIGSKLVLMPTKRITCDRGACYYSLELSWPGDDPTPGKTTVDLAFAAHRLAAHGEEEPGRQPSAPGVEPAVDIQTVGYVGDRPNLGAAVLAASEPPAGEPNAGDPEPTPGDDGPVATGKPLPHLDEALADVPSHAHSHHRRRRR
jgi:hypothetical protein